MACGTGRLIRQGRPFQNFLVFGSVLDHPLHHILESAGNPFHLGRARGPGSAHPLSGSRSICRGRIAPFRRGSPIAGNRLAFRRAAFIAGELAFRRAAFIAGELAFCRTAFIVGELSFHRGSSASKGGFFFSRSFFIFRSRLRPHCGYISICRRGFRI